MGVTELVALGITSTMLVMYMCNDYWHVHVGDVGDAAADGGSAHIYAGCKSDADSEG